MAFSAGNPSTFSTYNRSASLNDVRRIVESNSVLNFDTFPLPKSTLSFRPQLSHSNSAQNQSAEQNAPGDAPKKKTRRGGQRAREQRLIQSEHTNSTHNNNIASKQCAAPLPFKPNRVAHTQPRNDDGTANAQNRIVHKLNPSIKRGRVFGDTQPDLIHKGKRKSKPQTVTSQN